MGARRPNPADHYVGFDTRCEFVGGDLAALVAAGVLPTGRALDIGCGHGTEALFLAHCGWHVVGIDHDVEALAGAKERCRQRSLQRRAEFRHVKDFSLRGFTRSGFDVVLERLVYNNLFVDDDSRRSAASFTKLRRSLIHLAAHALRPGGLFVVRQPLVDDAPTGRWVESGPEHTTVTASDERLLLRYFDPQAGATKERPLGREVSFMSLATDPNDHHVTPNEDRVLVARPLAMTVRVLRRNEAAVT